MLLATITLACLGICSDPYVQDGFNMPEVPVEWVVQDGYLPPPLPRVEILETNDSEAVPLASEGTYRGMGNRTSDVEQWRPLVAGHFEPEDVERALCLMAHESGGNPNARNPRSSATGLFQIMASVWAPHFGLASSDLYVPEINVWAARKIKDIQGWKAWAPYNRGLCRD